MVSCQMLLNAPFVSKKHPRLNLTVQEPSQPVPRHDEVPFPPISQPGKLVTLDAMALEAVLRLLDAYIYQPLHGLK